MQKFKILEAVFVIDGNEVSIDGTSKNLKTATTQTLIFFLNSCGRIISKDDMLDEIWKDVVVSDASAFKQIQLLRKLFSESGLPGDVIENIYGKGYKLKYPVSNISQQEEVLPTNSVIAQGKIKQNKSFNYNVLAFVFILLLFSGFLYFYQPEEIKVTSFLNQDRTQTIEKLVASNWKEGLNYLNNFSKEHEQRLSDKDLGFLFYQKGKSKYHLNRFVEASEDYKLALDYYLKVEDSEETNKRLGDINLKIAQTLIQVNQPNIETPKAYINQAILFFKSANAKYKLIDAQMLLARMYAKKDEWLKSNEIYKKTISDAISFNDKVGEMIAINSLASNFVTVNDFQQALFLGEQGLDKALEIGKGRYIANSYSFMSDLYQRQFLSVKALEMIEMSLKYQLDSNELSNLPPKITTYAYILLQTYQFEKAHELLAVISEFFFTMPESQTSHIVLLYQGINKAHQGDWKNAQKNLSQAYKTAQQTNRKYRVTYLQAYYSLAYFFNENYIKALELATEIVKNKKNPQQDRAISALSLAYTYKQLNKPELADNWLIQAHELLNPKSLFEYHLLLKLQLNNLPDFSSKFPLIQEKLLKVESELLELKLNTQVDKDIYFRLVSHLKDEVANRVKSQSHDEK